MWIEETFENRILDTESLPQVEEVDFVPLKPAYKTFSMLLVCLTFGLLFLATVFPLLLNGFFDSFKKMGLYFLVLAVLFALRMFIKVYGYGKKGYAIRQHDVLYRSGIWWKRNAYIPRNRIQHIEIKKGPLEDVFDISRLLIFTAGGSGSDLVIPGLDPKTAERIKGHLMAQLPLDEEE